MGNTVIFFSNSPFLHQMIELMIGIIFLRGASTRMDTYQQCSTQIYIYLQLQQPQQQVPNSTLFEVGGGAKKNPAPLHISKWKIALVDRQVEWKASGVNVCNQFWTSTYTPLTKSSAALIYAHVIMEEVCKSIQDPGPRECYTHFSKTGKDFANEWLLHNQLVPVLNSKDIYSV